MAKKEDKLTQVSVRVGTALGKANKRARKIADAGSVAREELKEITKQVDSLKKQLAKTSDRLRKALAS